MATKRNVATDKKKVASAKKPPKRSYSARTIKILFTLSGNKCAVPDCHNPIIKSGTAVSDDLVLGQICHIYAASDDGPRGKPGLTKAEKNSPANLILCCPTHHVVVDGQHKDFPASLLLGWKRTQERAYRDRLSGHLNSIGYSELEIAARALLSHQASTTPDIKIIPPQDKIVKNSLRGAVELLLHMGAAKSHEVEEVLLKAGQLDSTFPDRLREGFVARYEELKKGGYSGDDLFYSMYDWAGGGNSDPTRQAAGLCILAHLFVICDVFEK